ncbi:MAG TPA: hypothetical protein VGM03_02430 [Phycisphaerae bacterium]
MKAQQRDECEQQLRGNLRARASELTDLLKSVSDHWGYEDPIYRFYHQSFKVYGVQEDTLRIVEVLKSLVPYQSLNPGFDQIIREGTGKEFDPEVNARWLVETRPMLEAFFHARYFLEMACRYSDPPAPERPMPSGWAALLYLFNLR